MSGKLCNNPDKEFLDKLSRNSFVRFYHICGTNITKCPEIQQTNQSWRDCGFPKIRDSGFRAPLIWDRDEREFVRRQTSPTLRHNIVNKVWEMCKIEYAGEHAFAHLQHCKTCWSCSVHTPRCTCILNALCCLNSLMYTPRAECTACTHARMCTHACVWTRTHKNLVALRDIKDGCTMYSMVPSHYNTLRHIAMHGDTLQHIAAHCDTLQHTAAHCNALQQVATHCNTLQHTATHCTTLPNTAPHCNTLQRTAT